VSAEEILDETHADILYDGPRDVLSESNDNVNNKSYSDFQPEIASKLKKTVHNLS
jgi:hypothetical protein